jgi:hypothetical protein
MSLSSFRQRHPRWARFLMLQRRTPHELMRGYARGLMSLASLGMFATAFGGLLMTFAVSEAYAGKSVARPFLSLAGLAPDSLARVPPAVAFSVVLLLATTAFACFVQLRRLGKALDRGPLLGILVASRFRWLGHLLSLNLFAGLILPQLVRLQTVRIGLGFNAGFLISLIGVFVCYAVAGIVREGVRAADENRGFV